MIERKYLTPGEVAEILSVSPVTVRQWAQKGKIKSRVTAGGHRRFLQEDVSQFASAYGHTLAETNDNIARILIVDDDKQLLGYLRELFITLPYNIEVEVAVDGYSAGRMVHIFKPNIILLDLMMPGMDGFEVCKHLKSEQTTRDTRVISMTGFPSKENVDRILMAGAEVCLSKPVNKDVLLDVIGIGFLESCGRRDQVVG
jgi:excisionase family DNA binding protein